MSSYQGRSAPLSELQATVERLEQRLPWYLTVQNLQGTPLTTVNPERPSALPAWPGASHELRSPLARMRMAIALLPTDTRPELQVRLTADDAF